jgi:hypothetical protein
MKNLDSQIDKNVLLHEKVLIINVRKKENPKEI